MKQEVSKRLEDAEGASHRLNRDLAAHTAAKNDADKQTFADRLTITSQQIGRALMSLQHLADALEKAHETFQHDLMLEAEVAVAIMRRFSEDVRVRVTVESPTETASEPTTDDNDAISSSTVVRVAHHD